MEVVDSNVKHHAEIVACMRQVIFNVGVSHLP